MSLDKKSYREKKTLPSIASQKLRVGKTEYLYPTVFSWPTYLALAQVKLNFMSQIYTDF